MQRLPLAAIIASAAILALTGCAASGDVAASPTTSPSAVPEVTASSSPTPLVGSPIALPSACADIIAAEDLGALVGLSVYEVPWDEIERPPGAHPGDELPGPAARAASRAATERIDCMWWPDPAFGWNFPLHVMRLDGETSQNLIDELRSSAEYEEATISGQPVFTHAYENGLGSMWASYAFVDDVWIAVATATPADRLTAAMGQVVERLS